MVLIPGGWLTTSLLVSGSVFVIINVDILMLGVTSNVDQMVVSLVRSSRIVMCQTSTVVTVITGGVSVVF